MSEETISIENVVRVTLALSELGMSAKNVNAVALFTNDTPIGLVDPYIIARNVKLVESTFGTNSLTTKMAGEIFAQNKNIITGNGYLAVIPLKSTVNATAPKTEFTIGGTEDATLTAFKAITNGTLKVTTNGVEYDLGGMNFAGCGSLTDVAKVIDNTFNDVEVSYDHDNTKFIFNGKKVGVSAGLTVASGTVAGATDILSDLGTAATTVGADATGETLPEAIARTSSAVAYCGIFSTAIEEDDRILAASTYVAGQKNYIYVPVFHSVTDVAGVCSTIKGKTETTTRCLLYGRGTYEDAKLMNAAYVGRAFSTNFNASNSSQTMNLKTLIGIEADNTVSETLYNACKTKGVDVYIKYNNGLSKTLSTGGNSFFDVVYENMALKFEIEANAFNALATTNTKLPQTEAGMSVLKSSVTQAFLKFKTAGVIGAGQWNSSDTFGDPETFRNNISQTGYYVYSQPIKNQLQSEREQRIAPVVQGACKRTGAIHECDVIVSVEN